MLLTILSSLLITLAYAQDKERTAENLKIMDSSNLVKDLYHLPPGVEIRDITSEILAHPQTLEEIKKNILEFHRRIVLFEYPSDGLKVKGYISFTPLSSVEPLLVLFRSGNRDFGLINPGNVWSTYKNYTILSSTLRGGVSQGVDEFGGADVADMKHLLDYLPVLVKKLAIQVAASPLYFLGPSRGGMEMFLTLARYPSIQQRVTKAVALSALLDLNQQIQNRPDDMKEMFINDFGLKEGINQKEWVARRNPIDHISSLDPCLPLLIIQATEDNRVSLQEGYDMVDKLKRAGHLAHYWEIEGAHTLHNRPGFMEEIASWLEQPTPSC